jgi:hypothetical protein
LVASEAWTLRGDQEQKITLLGGVAQQETKLVMCAGGVDCREDIVSGDRFLERGSELDDNLPGYSGVVGGEELSSCGLGGGGFLGRLGIGAGGSGV